MLSAWFPVAAYAVLIFSMSSIGKLSPGGMPNADKIAHLIEYGILGAVLARAWGRTLGWRRTGTRVVVVMMMGMFLAACDELYQGTVGRNRSAADWAADSVGVTLAAVADVRLRRWSRSRKQAAVGGEERSAKP